MKIGRRWEASDFYFLIPIIVLLIVWSLLSTLKIVNPALISTPWDVVAKIYDLLVTTNSDGNSILLTHIFASMYRLIVAFILAAAIGIFIGIILGARKGLYNFFDPVITFLMPIPGIAWAPIFMVFFGFGDLTIIIVSTLAAFFPIMYNVAAGVRTVDKHYIWAAQSMGAGKTTLFTRVYIPASAAYIFTGLKLGLSRGWKTVIAVEMIAASICGLGFMIFDAREYLQPSIIYAGIIILALIFYCIENGLIRWIESRTIERWGMSGEGGAL